MTPAYITMGSSLGIKLYPKPLKGEIKRSLELGDDLDPSNAGILNQIIEAILRVELVTFRDSESRHVREEVTGQGIVLGIREVPVKVVELAGGHAVQDQLYGRYGDVS